MKQKYINLYIDWAKRAAELSHAKRLKVGAVIVKDDTVISYGYNGTPKGWDNNCEKKEWMPTDIDIPEEEQQKSWPYIEYSDYDDQNGKVPIGRYRLVTKPEVLHAEMNSLMKLARGESSGFGASMFLTHAPCLECAKGIYQAGIKELFYREQYRSEEGLEFLKKCGIKVNQVKDVE